jgi:hypothetical protein
MRINLLTSFAAGIFITTSICGGVYFSTKSEDAKPAVQKGTVSLNDMKSKLAAEGYVVQTKAEYDKNTKKTKSSDKKQKKDSTSKDINSQQPVIRTTVTVSDGMTSYDVGKMLLAAKIITNQPFAFSKDIEARGLQNNLKPGAYEVDSSMSYDQIISTIFKK